MPEARELRAVLEAADQAAADGDYVAAELNLREAAALQEAQLGPFHPDLASTLNNLGIVYERANSPAEAELCYRRAYAIATRALEPNHPFVATSRTNLEEFCKARGRPFDRSVVADARPVPPKPLPRRWRPIVVSAAGALGVAILMVGVFWFRSSEPAGSSSPHPTQTSVQRQEVPIPSVSPESQDAPKDLIIPDHKTEARDSDSSTADDNAAAPQGERSAARATEAREAVATVPVAIAEAHLCRRLSTRDWRCEELASPVEPGLLFFYTRVKAVNNTAVEHRWYREDRLSQSVRLPIHASPGSGYRTYTRRTVTAANAGNWRVEVRATDGTLLHEERFLVR
jgi:tetratricopeptide (TPR) repeat protein